jgi:hypothetical protein
MVSNDEECLGLSLTDGDGSLQLSSALKDHGLVTPANLQWCADHLEGEWTTPVPVTFGPFLGIRVSTVQSDTYWCWWFLRAERVLLRASYNASRNVKMSELAQVENVLGSLRLNTTAALDGSSDSHA